MAVALALAVVFVGREAGSPAAEATTYNPQFNVSVSDPTPGAVADVVIGFSLDAPDSFPNVRTDSTVQFIPRQWGVTPGPVGAIAGTFDALTTLGIFGMMPCTFAMAVPFTMYEATTDTSNIASALDLGGDAHPGGMGYSGQFVEDPDNPGLPGGVTRYPDFLNQMFPPDVVGEPLTRQWGGQMVILSAVSLNIVTYSPGQLAAYGYPASLGYPNVVVLLNPVAPIEMYTIILTSDLCTPLALISTNSGVSQDNPDTAAEEGGYVRLTNPNAPKDYDFTLVTTSQPDADNDGIENMLDTCALTPNTENLDERGEMGDPVTDPDGDGLDGACDPDPLNPGPINEIGFPDDDLDNYSARADNCPLVANGKEWNDFNWAWFGPYGFFWTNPGDLIGPNNQTDSDGDDIGDACDPDPDTITGYMHKVTLTQSLPLYRHGVKLDNLAGPKKVKEGAKSYNVPVANVSNAYPEEIQVALQVLPGDCATVNGVVGQNSAVVSVGPGGAGSAHFTVDWTGCPDYVYTLRADACHAGDTGGAGFFGADTCPGVSDGMVDTNPLDDAPWSKDVTVGSP
jgi:hypothetical protein